MAEVKKENWFKRTLGSVAKYFRELRSELKKVVWPTPQQFLKNFLVVIACIIVVGVFIWLFDFLARVLINALIVAGCVLFVGVFIWAFDFVAGIGIEALINLVH